MIFLIGNQKCLRTPVLTEFSIQYHVTRKLGRDNKRYDARGEAKDV
jgi:hypothetical protein